MIGDPQPDRVEPAGDLIGHAAHPAQHHGERAWPEGRRQGRHPGIGAGPVTHLRRVGEVDDQRVIHRPALGGEDLADGERIPSAGPQAIDRLGGKSDQRAVAQQGGGFLQGDRPHGIRYPRTPSLLARMRKRWLTT